VDWNYCIIGTSATNGRNFNVQQVNGGAVRIVKWDRWGVAGYTPSSGVQPNVQFLASGIFTGSSGRTAFNGGSLSASENFSFAGSGTTNIGAGVLGDYFAGTINELVVYSTVLTDADRQEVEGYLAWKWGLQSKPPTSHPFKLTPPIMRNFQPTDVLAPTFWLDAADATTLTLSGSAITQWRDKSSNQYAGTSSGSPVQGTLNGRPAVAFNGSQVFDFGDVADLGSANLNMFVVCQFTTTGAGSVIAKSLYGDAQLRYSLLRESGSLLVLLQGDGGSAAPGVADTSTAPRLISWTWDRATQTLYLNGTSVLSASFANTATFNSSYKLLIGGYNDGTGGTPPMSFLAFNGTIGEVLFLFGTLTSAQRQQVEGYLAQKWGLGSSLPTSHPYRNVLPSTPLFSPVALTGCALWLDAADRSTLTLSGSNVTSWNDKSGNGRTATGVVAPTYDGTTRYILFNGSSQYFTLPNDTFPTGNTPYSMFFVAYTNNSANPQWIIAGGTESTNQAIGAIFYFTNAIWHSWWGNEYRVDNSISNGVPAILNLSYSTTRTTIVNGGTATTNTPGASRGSSSGPNFIGRRVSSVEYLNGGIGEIVIFASEIPTSQRQQVEGYLAWKWGLQSSLPSTHPFRKGRP
jgi:hypothetical protein